MMTVDEKAGKVTEAYLECISNDKVDSAAMLLLAKFFDIESRKNMDLKIEVLRRVANGDTVNEIYGFYDILDNYPGPNAKW